MLRRTFFAALSLFVLGACGDGDSTGPDSSITGTYQLQSYDGQSLPATVFEAGEDRFEITGGTLTLNQDQTYSVTFALRGVEGGVVVTETETDTGTYTLSNNTIQFSDVGGPNATGTVNGSTLTVTIDGEGTVLVFQKQSS